ncbi:hypothetical protein BT63DRAFT_424618 [Microthyrium microscopicum]|uniref:Cellobiose dehydrogenase-like cytochrome domain-containing protein n=1 Tax=Microthyrium microscopicum TaxID=703497 RepID=A0A6A6UFU9_9PEZI|nr:hypothetical protein BT63DRAFT_424618 [Microthyrium microscopicum]
MKLLSLALLATAGYVSAQDAEAAKAFTDPATGISFQAITSAKGTKFGIALPKTGSKDLIGFLVRGSIIRVVRKRYDLCNKRSGNDISNLC